MYTILMLILMIALVIIHSFFPMIKVFFKREYARFKFKNSLKGLERAEKRVEEIFTPFTPEDLLRHAKSALSELRAGAFMPASWNLNHIQEALDAGWSYADIGTTEEEILEHKGRKNVKAFAALWLQRCRGCEMRHDSSFFEYALKENGLTLECVGTNRKELDAFFKKPGVSLCTDCTHHATTHNP